MYKVNHIDPSGFALFSPAFTIGVTIAPLVGGFLSRPVPRLLSESWTLFADWPYLLPSLVTAVVGGIASFLAYLWLPEVSGRIRGELTLRLSHLGYATPVPTGTRPRKLTRAAVSSTFLRTPSSRMS
jgi:MFS family permease